MTEVLIHNKGPEAAQLEVNGTDVFLPPGKTWRWTEDP
jgi:hypothetical protein